jgi:nicotinate phosphoribosyltransferase
MDFAQRAHNHNYRLDPICRSRADLDAYKLFMASVIFNWRPNAQVTFQLTNRTKSVRLADIISMAELREQLDYAQGLKFSPSEMIHIRGQSYYGYQNLFSDAFLGHLGASKLPDYELSVDEESGQFILKSSGNWLDVMFWEIHFLTIVNELYARAQMRQLSKAQLDMMYARGKCRLYSKIERIAREAPDLTISEFGTRRRHSFLWQRWVIEAMRDVLGASFVGTSNVLHAMQLGLETKGTVAHEMSMVAAALAAPDGPEAIRRSQYEVLRQVQSVLPERLRVFLPDTFGTTQFLDGFPDDLLPQAWVGYRPDSKEPFEAGEEAIRFWQRVGSDPAKKLCIFSDGLDVDLPGEPGNGHDMIAIHKHFRGRLGDTYGWGTNATNSFAGTVPGHPDLMAPISIVAKAVEANGIATVKISDNPAKASSIDPEELKRYLEIFGVAGIGKATTTKV